MSCSPPICWKRSAFISHLMTARLLHVKGFPAARGSIVEEHGVLNLLPVLTPSGCFVYLHLISNQDLGWIPFKTLTPQTK